MSTVGDQPVGHPAPPSGAAAATHGSGAPPQPSRSDAAQPAPAEPARPSTTAASSPCREAPDTAAPQKSTAPPKARPDTTAPQSTAPDTAATQSTAPDSSATPEDTALDHTADTCPVGRAGGGPYDIAAAILRFVRLRSRRCTAPGCRVPARRCDTDHRVPWPQGPTCPCNLAPLCRRHHLAKHHFGWSVSKASDDPRDPSQRWRSPLGHDYVVRAEPLLPRSRATALAAARGITDLRWYDPSSTRPARYPAIDVFGRANRAAVAAVEEELEQRAADLGKGPGEDPCSDPDEDSGSGSGGDPTCSLARTADGSSGAVTPRRGSRGPRPQPEDPPF